jgi:hypothetical protein
MISQSMESLSRVKMPAMLLALVVMALAPFGAAVPQRPKPLPQPTEAQQGAPVYPGAVYQAEISGGMSQDEIYYWVYVTSDPAPKVAAFYKAKTGLTPMEISGNYMFNLGKDGNPYFPEHGIAIEPNKQLTAGPPKTAITFTKKK